MTKRLGLALGAVAALGLFAGGTASGSLASTTVAVGSSAGASGSGSAIACPTVEAPDAAITCGPVPAPWFLPGGVMPGITVTGQGVLNGSGPKVRDEAIRMAVADAREQAEIAAVAAGAKLGQVLSMQVSGSGYAYPIGVAQDTSGVAVTIPPCDPSGVCGKPISPPVQTYMTVTVTWAIAQ